MAKISIPSIDRILFSTSLTVRIGDINYGNHLGHDSLLTLLHEARLRFLKYYDCSEMNVYGAGVLVTTLAVKYLRQAFYADVLTINIGVGEMTASSVELIYEIKKNDQTIATAITTLTFFDYEKQKVVKIPGSFLVKITT